LRCIQSFKDQKLRECDKELIIVDDHSTDNTFQLVKSLTSNGEVILTSNKGQGIIDALQTGYAISTGSYISRMDADDIMPENKLASFYDLLQNTDNHIATGMVKYFHLHQSEVGDGYQKYERWLNTIAETSSYYNEIYKECVVASPNWLIRKEEVVIYGAGNKGKTLVKMIQEKTKDIVWCSNNAKKVGKSIYGVKLISDQEPIEKMNRQIIIAIAVENDKRKIKERLLAAGLIEKKDFFFFS